MYHHVSCKKSLLSRVHKFRCKGACLYSARINFYDVSILQAGWLVLISLLLPTLRLFNQKIKSYLPLTYSTHTHTIQMGTQKAHTVRTEAFLLVTKTNMLAIRKRKKWYMEYGSSSNFL